MKAFRRKMKWIYLAVLLFPFLASGCVIHSVHSFFTEEAVVEYADADGTWKLVKNYGDMIKEKPIKPWTFEGKTLTAYDEQGAKSELKMTFFKVKETLFMDLFPDSPSESTGFYWTAHVIPVHCVYKVELRKDSLVLIPLNYEWVHKEYDEGHITLPCVKFDEERELLFTASPAEWMAFLEKYKDDTKVFSTEYEFVLERMPAAENSAKKE